jgi:hypothetical protein
VAYTAMMMIRNNVTPQRVTIMLSILSLGGISGVSLEKRLKEEPETHPECWRWKPTLSLARSTGTTERKQYILSCVAHTT